MQTMLYGHVDVLYFDRQLVLLCLQVTSPNTLRMKKWYAEFCAEASGLWQRLYTS